MRAKFNSNGYALRGMFPFMKFSSLNERVLIQITHHYMVSCTYTSFSASFYFVEKADKRTTMHGSVSFLSLTPQPPSEPTLNVRIFGNSIQSR